MTRDATPLSFIKHLETVLRDDPPANKGMRTKLRLRISTAKVLEKKGYHALRVSDVSSGAKVAEGSFYIYFRDKTDAALDVLTDFFGNFFSAKLRTDGARSPIESVRLANRRYIAVCRANAGLMRCMFQLGDQDPTFADLMQKTNRGWYERVANSIQRVRPSRSSAAPLLAVYLLGGMMDDLVRKFIVYPDERFLALLEETKADDDAIADAATVIWLRVFYPEEALPKSLPKTASVLAKWLTP